MDTNSKDLAIYKNKATRKLKRSRKHMSKFERYIYTNVQVKNPVDMLQATYLLAKIHIRRKDASINLLINCG